MNYKENIQEIKKEFFKENFNLDDPYSSHRRNFLLIKANKTHLLNNYVDDEHFYKDMLFHQKLAEYDSQVLPDILDNIDVKGNLDLVKKAKENPCIFCSFHIGSFHSWPSLFAKFGIDFSVVINGNSFDQQSSKILKDMDNLRKKTGSDFNVEILNAEEPGIAIKMIREIKKKRSLFIYIDGNSGVGGNKRTDEKLLEIKFMNVPYFVRKGIAAIAHVTKTPIIPLISYRENDRIIQHVLDPIEPTSAKNKDDFAKETTQLLYNNFSPFLVKNPTQWESWLYINYYIAPQEENIQKLIGSNLLSKGDLLLFNSKRYSLLAEKEKRYLYDTFTYKTFTISSSLFDFLHNFDNFSANPEDHVSKELLNDLTINQVLL